MGEGRTPDRLSSDPSFALACFDLSGTVTYADAAYSRMLGRDASDIVGHSPFEFILAGEFEENRKRLQEMVESGEPCAFDKHYVQPDGTIVPARVHAFVLRARAGEVIGVCGVLQPYPTDDDPHPARRRGATLDLDALRRLTRRIQDETRDGEVPAFELRRFVAEAFAGAR